MSGSKKKRFYERLKKKEILGFSISTLCIVFVVLFTGLILFTDILQFAFNSVFSFLNEIRKAIFP